MNINGIGSQSALSWFDKRAKEKEEQQQQVQQAKVEARTQAAVSTTNSANFQAEQAFEESFARLRFNLQSNDVSASSASTGSAQVTSDAHQSFSDYMNMSDAEKVRANMLREVGLTEDEFEQLSPEQQAAIGEKIAQRLKDRIEQQVNQQTVGSPTAEQLLAS